MCLRSCVLHVWCGESGCGAAVTSAPWDYLLDPCPDVALLQEVISVPDKVREQYACQEETAMTHRSPQRFSTVLLVRGRLGQRLVLPVSVPWVAAELAHFAGNVVAMELFPHNGPAIKAVSVYSPAWTIGSRLDGVDTTGVHLDQNPDLWVADLLRASLEETPPDRQEPWIVAGDFNLSAGSDERLRLVGRPSVRIGTQQSAVQPRCHQGASAVDGVS